MTLEELEQLNDRRKVVINNREYYQDQLKRLKSRIHEHEEQLATANDLIDSIDYTLMEHLEQSTPMITALNCVDARNRATIMLKIEIDGIENPIFKVLDPHDFELYKKDESMVDEMVFRNRLIELGLEYIKKDGKISAHFERISRNFVLAPQHFVRSTLTLRRLQQRRM
jgi:hypothetical protein